MFNTIMFVSIGLCAVLLVLLILCYIRYRRVIKKYNNAKSDWLYTKNKCSLVESRYRAYVEGDNPFTVLRDLGEIIYAGYIPPHNGEI